MSDQDKSIFMQISFIAWKSGGVELTEKDLDDVAAAVADILSDLGYNSEGSWALCDFLPKLQKYQSGETNG